MERCGFGKTLLPIIMEKEYIINTVVESKELCYLMTLMYKKLDLKIKDPIEIVMPFVRSYIRHWLHESIFEGDAINVNIKDARDKVQLLVNGDIHIEMEMDEWHNMQMRCEARDETHCDFFRFWHKLDPLTYVHDRDSLTGFIVITSGIEPATIKYI